MVNLEIVHFYNMVNLEINEFFITYLEIVEFLKYPIFRYHNIMFLLFHVLTGDIQQTFKLQWHICLVMQFVLIVHLLVTNVLPELSVFLLSAFTF